MARSATEILGTQDHVRDSARQIAVLIGASLLVAICARVTLPLPFTPVPLTLQNFGVLLVGLALGPRRGFAALMLYLAEGVSGLPVFSPTGPGGIAQLFGPTGGFLLAYPFVAGIAGWVFENSVAVAKKSFARAMAAGILAEVFLFACGICWLAVLTHSFAQAVRFGLYWFVFAEVIKIMAAAALASGWRRFHKVSS